MNLSRTTYFSMMVFTVMLIALVGYLFRQNNIYRSANRKLILQNDSLTSVVIELNRKVDTLSYLKITENYNPGK